MPSPEPRHLCRRLILASGLLLLAADLRAQTLPGPADETLELVLPVRLPDRVPRPGPVPPPEPVPRPDPAPRPEPVPTPEPVLRPDPVSVPHPGDALPPPQALPLTEQQPEKPDPVPAPDLPGGLTVEGQPVDPNLFLAPVAPPGACASCGGAGCLSCGGSTACVPGRGTCVPLPTDTLCGRFFAAVYNSVCCPDPCYVPRWTGLANAALFVDGARPVTQTRFRWDAGRNVVNPDRAEYFWPRADGGGLGPRPNPRLRGFREVDYDELTMYTETATGAFSVTFEIPYRWSRSADAPVGAGVGDMVIGTKTLLTDSELLQVAFQFRTHLPTGNRLKGAGTGHVSLEPSLIMGLQLAPASYLQAQVAEWIPLGGDPDYQGSLLHYHFSYNQLLWSAAREIHLFGTFEFNGWSFQDGLFSDPVFGPQSASGATYLSMGPGFRGVICDKLDVGVGTAFALTKRHWARHLFRCEFRYRY